MSVIFRHGPVPLCLWWQKTLNVGDRFCGVSVHVALNAEPRHLDQATEITRDRVVVIGGGGLLHPPMQHIMQRIVASKPYKLIVWGIGTNTHGSNIAEYPDWLNKCDLVGLRDWQNPFQWVPCSTCMSPLFDSPAPPTQKIVVYRHFERASFLTPEAPVMFNNVKTMEQALCFLASGETIVTDSYHGAYWGTLLGRRVVSPSNWSSKFQSFRHPPARTPEDAVTYPAALEECRYSVRQFWKQFTKLSGC